MMVIIEREDRVELVITPEAGGEMVDEQRYILILVIGGRRDTREVKCSREGGD